MGDWVIGPTHNSAPFDMGWGKDKKLARVGYVAALMEDGGTCNVKLRVWVTKIDSCGGNTDYIGPGDLRNSGQEDYAYTADLLHVMDGYRLASICAEAWKWDSDINPAPTIES